MVNCSFYAQSDKSNFNQVFYCVYLRNKMSLFTCGDCQTVTQIKVRTPQSYNKKNESSNTKSGAFRELLSPDCCFILRNSIVHNIAWSW